MSSRVGVNLRASAYLHQGDRKYMEDEFQVAYQRTHDKKDIEYAFFGIFDGHGGKEAAHFAKDNLMDNIVSQRLFWSENDEDVLCAIKEGFLQTHMAMWKELDKWPRTASGWPSTSGTTASIAFIRRQKIYIGHVGDSGIVLGLGDGSNEWVGVPLTRDHKPESVLEMNRITESGGKVIVKSGVPRVVWNRPKSGHQGPVRRSTPMDEIPFLAVARSLGDLWSYNASNNQFVVSPEPDVCVIDIDITSHRCLIFGTDGLWNALFPSSAVNIAYNSEKNNEKHYLGVPMGCGKQRLWINPSRCIVTGALDRYQLVNLRADNTSAVTVYLDPPGRPKREVLLQQLSLKKGWPSKNSSPKTPNKKLKEASVKVHVYNQTPTAEANRGILWIKERLPGDKRAGSASPPLPGASPEFSPSSDDYPTPGDSDVSGSTEEREGSPEPCSECGCTNRSSSSDHTMTHVNADDTHTPEHSSTAGCCSARSSGDCPSSCTGKSGTLTPGHHKNDDIQIPLVSSSTYIEGAEEEKEETSTHKTTKGKVGGTPSSRTHSSSKRWTRSSISHLPPRVTNENKKNSNCSTTPKNTSTSSSVHNTRCPSPISSSTSSNSSNNNHVTSRTSLPTAVYVNDSSHRVLKNVNRSSSRADLNPHQGGTMSPLSTSKRKRSREVPPAVYGERSPKSLRVNTRLHSKQSKSMITRSQEKSELKRCSK